MYLNGFLKDEIHMMQTLQSNSWGFHVAFEIKINI